MSCKTKNLFNIVTEMMIIQKLVCTWWILIGIYSYFAHAAYDFDEISLEELFLEYHENLDNIVWDEIRNLTAEMHERICFEVLGEVIPKVHKASDYDYIAVPTERIQAERVMRMGILQLQKFKVIIPVVKCEFVSLSIYITHAKDDHVFDLYRERNTMTYTLRSGIYRVHYD